MRGGTPRTLDASGAGRLEGLVTTLVIDLDRPQEGVLNVSQQALVDVQRAIGSPTR